MLFFMHISSSKISGNQFVSHEITKLYQPNLNISDYLHFHIRLLTEGQIRNHTHITWQELSLKVT